jgi:hypothetical protein
MLLLLWTRVYVRVGSVLYVLVAVVLVRCGLHVVEGGSGWCGRGEAEADDFGAAEVEVFWPSLADSLESKGVCAAIVLVELTVDNVNIAECVCLGKEERLNLYQAKAPPA